MLLIFIEKKKQKKMETEIVRKQLKIIQNIFKMVWCVENANINIQSKLHGSTFISFKVTAKTKIDFVEYEVSGVGTPRYVASRI